YGRAKEEITWSLDRAGNPIHSVPKLDAAGRLAEVRFETDRGKPALHFNGHHLQKFTYDARGNNTVVTHFGLQGEPVSTPRNAHRWTKEYDEAGRMTAEAFFRVDGRPAAPAGRAHRHTLAYARAGRCADGRLL